ncbi:MAG TPA: VIT1/CCC1 transporter family protein [Flavitalea sp.]|nr:VIT1/CCC1 transporter family protein [Flavitalea sp.]
MKKNIFTRNICIGLVDGLTIPLALAAGLSGLVINSSSVIIACLVASLAGAMTMTIGGFFESRKYAGSENPVVSAVTIGGGYFSGGMVATLPYFFHNDPMIALCFSAIVTIAVLFIAGYWESKLNGSNGWTNAVRVCVTGAVAACAAFFIGKLFR